MMDSATIRQRIWAMGRNPDDRLDLTVSPKYHPDLKLRSSSMETLYAAWAALPTDRLLAARVLMRFDDQDTSTAAKFIDNILQYRNSTVSEDYGHPTPVQAPDPVDSDLPR